MSEAFHNTLHIHRTSVASVTISDDGDIYLPNCLLNDRTNVLHGNVSSIRQTMSASHSISSEKSDRKASFLYQAGRKPIVGAGCSHNLAGVLVGL